MMNLCEEDRCALHEFDYDIFDSLNFHKVDFTRGKL